MGALMARYWTINRAGLARPGSSSGAGGNPKIVKAIQKVLKPSAFLQYPAAPIRFGSPMD